MAILPQSVGVQRAAIYVRVSSAGQSGEDRYSLPTQDDACRRHAADHGYVVPPEHVYREVHTGVELWERPELTRLREAMRARSFDVLIFYALDRLSREDHHIGLLASEAEHVGVRLECVTEVFDESPTGRLIMAAKGFAAKVEHEKLKERTQRGRRARADQGKIIVGPRPAYGYQWSADRTKYEVNPTTGPVVQEMFRRAVDGATLYQIVDDLNTQQVPRPGGRPGSWLRSTVRYILGNPLYTGQATAFRFVQVQPAGKKRTMRLRPADEQVTLPDGTAPALVDAIAFDAAQARLSRNRETSIRNNRAPAETLLRAGYIFCGYCGSAMHSMRPTPTATTMGYRCSRTTTYPGGCSGHGMSARLIDTVVWQKLTRVLTQPELIAAELEARINEPDPSRENLRASDRAIAGIERQQRNLVENLSQVTGSAVSLVAQRLEQLEVQHRKLVEDREVVLQARAGWEEARTRLADLNTWCQRVARHLESPTYEQKRLVLEAFGVRVKIWRADHEPRWEITATIDLDGAEPVILSRSNY